MSQVENNTQPKLPLSGIKILDFSRILSGPYASMMLADLGAEVIKIETLESGDETRNFPPFKEDMSHYFIALNRNKKSMTLNLKSEKGVAIAKELVKQSDVVIENFRPGVMDKLGLSYDTLSALNPSLVYCSISGFGQDGPLRDKPAFDIVAQALSGIMSINGTPETGNSKLGIPLGDLSGSIFAVFGIQAALIERQRTHKGKFIDISMLDGLIGLLGYLSQIYFVTGQSPQAMGSMHASIVPYGTYPTKDGFVVVACLTQKFWENFANAIFRPELIKDDRFLTHETRLINRIQLEELIHKELKKRDSKYWLSRMNDFDVPNAPMLSVGEALEQDHCKERNLVSTIKHPKLGDIKVVGNPIKFGDEGITNHTAPPYLGEHSTEILSTKLGLEPHEIEKLKADKII